ncbi:hypothetical protein Ancab_026976 [Ancistrocladus abbreviatus]
MCSREEGRIKTSSKSSKNNTATKTCESMEPAARKARTKIRKPKFLSLRLELSSETTKQSTQMPSTDNQKQLNLFPLHPENSADDKEVTLQDHENMAYYFEAADGGATTLMDLLNASSASEDDAEEEDQAALSTYGAAAVEEQESQKGRASTLVRTALRNRERDASEDKWVSISEVLEQKEEEVTSTAIEPLWLRWGGGSSGSAGGCCGSSRLLLKLDYEEVLNAWSDKGSLYVEKESPQTVPDLNDNFLYNWSHGNRGLSLWSVPEKSCGRMEDEKGEKARRLTGQREASVLRYKEKRQSRLFAKRIRYEVRRLNAEKRPRVKGRFVKRS